MRIYRCLPMAFARQLRTFNAQKGIHNGSNALRTSLRVEQGAIRCFSTTNGPAIGKWRNKPPSSIPHHSESSPALAMLQTLAKWTGKENTVAHAKRKQREGPALSLARRNQVLEEAIQRGNFVHAQWALQALLETWVPGESSHPVYTENYDRLLYQWSRHCGKRVVQAGTIHVDLTPMLTLLEAMVAWNRVNARSFNTALVACQRVKALEAGQRVLEMMKQSGRQPKAFAYTTLISCCARLASSHKRRSDRFIDEAERFFQELVTGDTGVTIEAVNAMIFAYRAGRGRSATAVELIERAIREWHLHPDSSTLAPLLIALMKARNPVEAARWLEYALTHRIQVDNSIIKIVLDECRREAHWNKVELLQEQLQELGIAQKDSELQRILKQNASRDSNDALPVAVRSGARHSGSISIKQQKTEATMTVKEAIECIERGKRVELTRTQWVNMFEHGKIDELDKLMHLLLTPILLQEPMVPQRWLNEMYLRTLGSMGQWWRIVRALDEMLAKTRDEVPIVCFNAALQGCTRAGRLQEAFRVKERMGQANVKLNRHSYEALLRCCGSIGSPEAAIQLFREMELAGIEPKTADLNAVLRSVATAVHRLIQASQDESLELNVPSSDLNQLAVYSLHFFEDVTTKYPQIEITEGTLIQLFRSFLGAAEMFDVVDLQEFEVFVAEEDHSNHKSHAEWILLSNAIQQICRDAPESVVTARVINVGIDFFQRRGEPSSAFELFSTMVSRGITPTADSVRLLFTACCSGDEDTRLGLLFLDHLIEDMKDDTKSELSQAIASEALRWAGRMVGADDHDGSALVDTVFDKLVAANMLTNDVSIYARVMAVFGQDGNLVQAQRVVDRMLAETGTVSLAVANRLLQACSVARTPIAALNTLGWMRYHGVQPDRMSYNSVLSAIHRHQEKLRRVGVVVDDHEDKKDQVNLLDENAEVSEDPSVWHTERLSRIETDLNAVLDDLLSSMGQDNVAPSGRTFESLIGIATVRGEMRRVLELFDNLKAAASKQQVDVSALLTVNTVLNYLDACAAVASLDPLGITSRVQYLRSLLQTWYRERRYVVSSATVLRILQAYDALGHWEESVSMLKNVTDDLGVRPNLEMFKTVMETCNQASQYQVAEELFVEMQQPKGSNGRVLPTPACYVEAIYALEQQDKWNQATQLFVEMQKKCSADDLHPALLNRIALGRYAEGRKRPD